MRIIAPSNIKKGIGEYELRPTALLTYAKLLWKEPYDARQDALNQALEPGSRGIMTYDRVSATTSFPMARLNNPSTALKIGAGIMTMSPDGRFLAVRNGELPDSARYHKLIKQMRFLILSGFGNSIVCVR